MDTAVTVIPSNLIIILKPHQAVKSTVPSVRDH
jgi:hypothetical protein